MLRTHRALREKAPPGRELPHHRPGARSCLSTRGAPGQRGLVCVALIRRRSAVRHRSPSRSANTATPMSRSRRGVAACRYQSSMASREGARTSVVVDGELRPMSSYPRSDSRSSPGLMYPLGTVAHPMGGPMRVWFPSASLATKPGLAGSDARRWLHAVPVGECGCLTALATTSSQRARTASQPDGEGAGATGLGGGMRCVRPRLRLKDLGIGLIV